MPVGQRASKEGRYAHGIQERHDTPDYGLSGVAFLIWVTDICAMSIREILVSELGKPHNPFGMSDVLIILVAIVGLFGLEWVIGRTIRNLGRHIWTRVTKECRKANKP